MTKDSKVRAVLGLVVAALVVGTIAVGAAYAQQAGQRPAAMMGRRGMMAGGPLGAMRRGLGQLGLSDQQKQQIKGIVQGHKEEVKGFAVQIRQTRRALADTIANDRGETAIRDKSADLAKVQADLAVFRAKVRKEVFDVLTPEQQAKAKTLRLHARGRMDRFLERRK
ncbi:MAG TPA: Spy/CpxP family protein refolding chaperone [Vicinamibacterales bacterium]